jgi:hypothetical protein
MAVMSNFLPVTPILLKGSYRLQSGRTEPARVTAAPGPVVPTAAVASDRDTAQLWGLPGAAFAYKGTLAASNPKQ